jgi:flagellar basal body-associated protein FliL
MNILLSIAAVILVTMFLLSSRSSDDDKTENENQKHKVQKGAVVESNSNIIVE